jgi:hypothetical protein
MHSHSSGEEGFAHWGLLMVDKSCRSAYTQRFNRALQRDPKAAAIYHDLPDGMKQQFKVQWGHVASTMGHC